MTTRDDAKNFLSTCSDHDLTWVLEHALSAREPLPEERRATRYRLYLGIASSDRNDDGKSWGRFEPAVVAWVDHPKYDGEFVGEPFCQHGQCEGCGSPTLGAAKHGICGACGS